MWSTSGVLLVDTTRQLISVKELKYARSSRFSEENVVTRLLDVAYTVLYEGCIEFMNN